MQKIIQEKEKKQAMKINVQPPQWEAPFFPLCCYVCVCVCVCVHVTTSYVYIVCVYIHIHIRFQDKVLKELNTYNDLKKQLQFILRERCTKRFENKITRE